ncbi:MAG: DNA polymerase I [Gammaproteobacteria bacterium]|nr:DNA polymerase I [Gammaproteobacteria bacterium]MBT3861110.1 DNA polymerase I [Gammaproteobacteria bacterium]MBT3987680.1 DNA polymerase I [Gammaproteobacteria bacterium]MBT4257386.1 DNA polymerase I [Gammaproteobacteria bacterium]MBT4582740.1 DNA polymerase I [Gammaproteobacteria bacterium]
MAEPKELILVDGSSYLFRAFHALPPLESSKGQQTGAVKGVINMIRSLIKNHPDSNIAVVFDAKGKTFRSDVYPEYKAHRPPMPDELRSQIQPIHQIIEAMGLPMLIIPGVEADDVIGTLAVRATAAGMKSLISTGDKDLAQLVNGNVTLMNTMTNEILDIPGVEKKFGIGPKLIIDYLALMGDKADNIPGVPSVGPKTAVKWLLEYGSMEKIIDNAEAVGGKVGEKLRENIEQLRLSYDLATIKLDVEVDTKIEELVHGKEDGIKLHDLFSELEFKGWISELEGKGISGSGKVNAESSGDSKNETKHEEELKESSLAPITAPEKIDYQTISTEAELQKLLKVISPSKSFAINLETSEGHFLERKLIGISISPEIGSSFYIPLAHDYEEAPSQLDTQLVLAELKPVLENPSVNKLGYDLKQVSHILKNHDIELKPLKFDVLLASYVTNSVASKHRLIDIARIYLDVSAKNLEELLGKGRNKLKLHEVPIESFSEYAAEKADLILRASIRLQHELSTNGHLLGLFQYYEMPLVEVLETIERNGILVDSKVLAKQSDELGKSLETLQIAVFEIAGEEFNLGSPKQLQAIFYEKLELPILKKTKTGQPSTAEPILQELAKDYEMPRLILEHRSLSKLKSTYTDKLPLEVNEGSGRIHSSFQQAVAATGRLSSTDPNLQNIPIRTAEGRRVRQAFICDKGNKLMAADYSQVELRIMAHLSQDEGLLQAFSEGVDVHKATASEVFAVDLEDVTTDQRRSAKAINFGLIYGMSAFGLANQLDIPRKDAAEYVERYFERYPGVRKYMDETQAFADEKGYVETLFGRRLYLPDIHAGNGMLRKAAQRTAINAPMQGTAADIIKRAMIDIDHWLAMGELDARMLLQVHDELVFEVKEGDLELLSEGVEFRMASAAALDVPLVVDIGVGDNWDEAH